MNPIRRSPSEDRCRNLAQIAARSTVPLGLRNYRPRVGPAQPRPQVRPQPQRLQQPHAPSRPQQRSRIPQAKSRSPVRGADLTRIVLQPGQVDPDAMTVITVLPEDYRQDTRKSAKGKQDGTRRKLAAGKSKKPDSDGREGQDHCCAEALKMITEVFQEMNRSMQSYDAPAEPKRLQELEPRSRAVNKGEVNDKYENKKAENDIPCEQIIGEGKEKENCWSKLIWGCEGKEGEQLPLKVSPCRSKPPAVDLNKPAPTSHLRATSPIKMDYPSRNLFAMRCQVDPNVAYVGTEEELNSQIRRDKPKSCKEVIKKLVEILVEINERNRSLRRDDGKNDASLRPQKKQEEVSLRSVQAVESAKGDRNVSLKKAEEELACKLLDTAASKKSFQEVESERTNNEVEWIDKLNPESKKSRKIMNEGIKEEKKGDCGCGLNCGRSEGQQTEAKAMGASVESSRPSLSPRTKAHPTKALLAVRCIEDPKVAYISSDEDDDLESDLLDDDMFMDLDEGDFNMPLRQREAPRQDYRQVIDRIRQNEEDCMTRCFERLKAMQAHPYRAPMADIRPPAQTSALGYQFDSTYPVPVDNMPQRRVVDMERRVGLEFDEPNTRLPGHHQCDPSIVARVAHAPGLPSYPYAPGLRTGALECNDPYSRLPGGQCEGALTNDPYSRLPGGQCEGALTNDPYSRLPGGQCEGALTTRTLDEPTRRAQMIDDACAKLPSLFMYPP